MPRPRTASNEAILAAAARVIVRHGPAKLTLAAVAEQAGLAPATLVQRFGSKRGLLLALVRQAESDVRRPFEDAREGRRSPLAALHAALAELASDVGTPDELANHLAFLQMDLTDPEFRRHAAAHAWTMRREITGLLDDAVAAGELTAEQDTKSLARSVHVTYNGSLISWALIGDGSLADALRADLDQLLRPYRTADTRHCEETPCSSPDPLRSSREAPAAPGAASPPNWARPAPPFT
ncbi:MAG: TetR family transcriptional regulator [Streptosporangiales bacterium]|nr:TetR family transcriptional regulator [Streptosporangiales bacterium]